MAILYKNLRSSIINSFPLITLYYLSISEIDTHFSNTSLKCNIQPPWENSQFLSHIHGFIVNTPIGDLPELYRDIEIILKIKKERISDIDVSEAEEEDDSLSRTVTNAGGLSRTMTTGGI